MLDKLHPINDQTNHSTSWTCADPGIFARGGGGGSRSIWQKSSDKVFFFFFVFLVLRLFYWWLISKKTIIFQGSRGGPTFSRGGPTFPGGSNCLFPIGTHITCDFPGGVQTPCPPSGSTLVEYFRMNIWTNFLLLSAIYPTKKRNTPLWFSPLSSPFNTKMLIVMKYSFLIKSD